MSIITKIFSAGALGFKRFVYLSLTGQLEQTCQTYKALRLGLLMRVFAKLSIFRSAIRLINDTNAESLTAVSPLYLRESLETFRRQVGADVACLSLIDRKSMRVDSLIYIPPHIELAMMFLNQACDIYHVRTLWDNNPLCLQVDDCTHDSYWMEQRQFFNIKTVVLFPVKFNSRRAVVEFQFKKSMPPEILDKVSLKGLEY